MNKYFHSKNEEESEQLIFISNRLVCLFICDFVYFRSESESSRKRKRSDVSSKDENKKGRKSDEMSQSTITDDKSVDLREELNKRRLKRLAKQSQSKYETRLYSDDDLDRKVQSTKWSDDTLSDIKVKEELQNPKTEIKVDLDDRFVYPEKPKFPIFVRAKLVHCKPGLFLHNLFKKCTTTNLKQLPSNLMQVIKCLDVSPNIFFSYFKSYAYFFTRIFKKLVSKLTILSISCK